MFARHRSRKSSVAAFSGDHDPSLSRDEEDTEQRKVRISRFFQRYEFLPFVLPLAVYLAIGQFAPHKSSGFDHSAQEVESDSENGRGLFSERTTGFRNLSYPAFYTLQIGVTIVVTLLALPVYREFRVRIGVLPVLAGLLGALLWIGLCHLELEAKVFERLGQDWFAGLSRRAAYDPLTALGDQPVVLAGFLSIRFFGLVCLVPLIEEFFLRGFLMRWVVQADWTNVPIGRITVLSALVGTLYGVLSHPGEFLAAAVWFSLITWLMWKTKSIWSCVAAHAVTNLLLGLYIVSTREWSLW